MVAVPPAPLFVPDSEEQANSPKAQIEKSPDFFVTALSTLTRTR
jgi:hypothetical protein